jgi:hypothetical protein
VQCPKTVENFTTHAKTGYYDGIIFHRVIKGFMLQTGDPLGGLQPSACLLVLAILCCADRKGGWTPWWVAAFDFLLVVVCWEAGKGRAQNKKGMGVKEVSLLRLLMQWAL